jgi:hypothetical protein
MLLVLLLLFVSCCPWWHRPLVIYLCRKFAYWVTFYRLSMEEERYSLLWSLYFADVSTTTMDCSRVKKHTRYMIPLTWTQTTYFPPFPTNDNIEQKVNSKLEMSFREAFLLNSFTTKWHMQLGNDHSFSLDLTPRKLCLHCFCLLGRFLLPTQE